MGADSQRERARLDRGESRDRIVAAATALIRERGFTGLSIGEIMERAGIGRTIFYRHFDDLGDLLMKASREAIEALYATEVELSADEGPSGEVVRAAIESAVSVYSRHGPLLRALSEAAPSDERISGPQEAIRARFDELVAGVLSPLPGFAGKPEEEVLETARALNLVNTAYLTDAYGREPRVSEEVAVQTLSGIWLAVVERAGG